MRATPKGFEMTEKTLSPAVSLSGQAPKRMSLDDLGKQRTDLLQKHLDAGATIYKRDYGTQGLWWLYDIKGEGIASGASIWQMLGDLVEREKS